MKLGKGVFSKALIISISLCFSSGALSSPDISADPKNSEGNTEYVRVTKNIDDTISFEYCESAAARNCQQIGKKKSYRVMELKRKHRQLRKDGFQMARADLLFVVASALASTITLTISSTPVGWAAIAVTALSGGVGSAVFVFKGYLTPGSATFYRNLVLSDTVTDQILSDAPVMINEPIYRFVAKLDEVLKSIP